MSNTITSAENVTNRRGFLRRFFEQNALLPPEIAEHHEKFNLNQPYFMDEPFIGEILITAFDYAPRGWALCNGQTLSIDSFQALFSLIGTTYGGDGVTTFKLPDFRGRCPIHFGQGYGLSNYAIGQRGGHPTHTLSVAEMPEHSHTLTASTGQVLGTGTQVTGMVQVGSLGTTTDITLANAGGSLSHNNMPPYLVLSFCIATEGVYPSQL